MKATTIQTVSDVTLVFVLSVVIYLNVLRGEFVFDDLVAIVDNKDVKPDQPLEKVFEHDFWGQNLEDWQSHKSYRPLTILSFRLSYVLSGQRWDEVHFHLTNVILHGLVSVLVLPVAYRCFWPRRFAALASALFFATHPIHTDAVSSIVSRGEQLSAAFLLLSFLAYSEAASLSRGLLATLFWVPVSLGLAFVGMLCKEQAITVVAIQAAYDLCAVSPALYTLPPVEAPVCSFLECPLSKSWLGSFVLPRPSTACEEVQGSGAAAVDEPSSTDARGATADGKDEGAREDGEEEQDGGEKSNGAADDRSEVAGHAGAAKDGNDVEQAPTSGLRGGASRSGWGAYQGALLLLRLAMIGVGFMSIYSWRMAKNGECRTVFKSKGDPLISAWDAAGTVSPGIYSESACRPNFLQVENPARFVKGENGTRTRVLTWSYCAAYHGYLLLNPTTLRADYSHNTIPLLEDYDDPRNAATIAFACVLCSLALYGVLRAAGPTPDASILLSLSFLVVPFVPSSNLFFPVGFVVAERVLYAPSLGFCMLLGLAVDALGGATEGGAGGQAAAAEDGPGKGSRGGNEAAAGLGRGGGVGVTSSRRKVMWGAVVVVVVLYAGRTWVRNGDWVSREGFYGAMVRDNPMNPKAHYGYGNIVINDVKRTAVGERHLLEASRLQPNYFDAYNDLGAWYNRNGQLEAAREQFEWAVRAKPEHINGLSNQGLNFLSMRDYENAFMVFDKAVEFFPDSAEFYNNMGMALQGLGMQEDALQAYSDIIVLDPLSPRSYYLYAIAAGQMGRTSEAELYFRNAVRIQPWYVDALYNLGVCLMKQERMEEAYAYFLRVHYVNHQHPGLAQYMEMLRGE